MYSASRSSLVAELIRFVRRLLGRHDLVDEQLQFDRSDLERVAGAKNFVLEQLTSREFLRRIQASGRRCSLPREKSGTRSARRPVH